MNLRRRLILSSPGQLSQSQSPGKRCSSQQSALMTVRSADGNALERVQDEHRCGSQFPTHAAASIGRIVVHQKHKYLTIALFQSQLRRKEFFSVTN